MPGFDKSRIIGLNGNELDEFTCPICMDIFINPKFTHCCRQTYCKDCIKKWVSQNKTCPNDRKKLNMRGVKAVTRFMTNLLDNLKVKCVYETDGCSQAIKLGDLSQHLTVCDYRPNQLCKTCGLMRECVSTHNCIQSLITEKKSIESIYLNLFEEKCQLLSEKEETHQIITTLRNDIADMKNNQHLIVEELKAKHSNAMDLIKISYDIVLEKERKNHQRELDDLKQTYHDMIKRIPDLECELSDYKSKLDVSEDKCRTLKVVNEGLLKDFNSNKISTENSITTLRHELDNINNNYKGIVDKLENLLKMC